MGEGLIAFHWCRMNADFRPWPMSALVRGDYVYICTSKQEAEKEKRKKKAITVADKER